MAGANVNPILEAAKKSVTTTSAEIAKAASRQEVITTRTEQAGKDLVESTKTIGIANQIVQHQSDIADLEAQKSRKAIFEAAGGSEFFIGLMKELNASSKEVIAAQKQVDKVANKPVNGLIDYIGQQINLIVPEDKLANAKQKVTETSGIINTISAAQESSARAILLAKNSLNIAVIEEKAKAAAALTQQAVSEAELKSLANNSAQLRAGTQANVSVMQTRLEEYRLHNTEIAQEQRQQEFELQKQSLELRLKEYQASQAKSEIDLEAARLRLAEAKDPQRKAAMQAQYEETIRKHQDNIAFRIEATNSVKKAQAILKQPIEDDATIIRNINNPRSADKYMTLMAMGAGVKPVIGNTPADAVSNIATISPVGISDSPPMAVLSYVQQAQLDDYAGYPKQGKTVPKDKTTLKADFNRTAKRVFKDFSKLIRTGDTSNFYHAPPIGVLSEYESVKSTKLWKNVLEPMSLVETNPKTIFEAAISGINAKTISVEDATDGIEALYKAAIDYNNTHYNFEGIGIPVQENYVTPDVVLGPETGVTLGLGLSPKFKTKPVDLSDPIQIKQAIIRELNSFLGYKGFSFGGEK